MRFTVRCDDFYPARARLIPPTKEDEDWPDEYHDGFMRIEAAGDRVRLSGPFGEEIVPAQVDEPGVAFLIYREFMGMTEKESTDHLFGESDELTFTGNEKELCTQFWCCLIGDGELAYFPDPETAPRIYTLPPPKTWAEQLRERFGDGEADDAMVEDADVSSETAAHLATEADPSNPR